MIGPGRERDVFTELHLPCLGVGACNRVIGRADVLSVSIVRIRPYGTHATFPQTFLGGEHYFLRAFKSIKESSCLYQNATSVTKLA